MKSASERPLTPAEETLDLALLTGCLVAICITYALVAWAGLRSIPEVIAIIVGDCVGVFGLVPFLVARWLGRDIDDLVGGESSRYES